MARSFRRGGRTIRRESLWIGIGAANTNLAAANSAVLTNSFNAAALALRPFTIVRTRGVWMIRNDQTAATELQQAALAMAVVSDVSVSIGISAVPTGFADIGSDLFFVYEQQAQEFVVNSAVGTEVYTGVQYDSKAMRKVEDGQDLAVTLEASAISAGVNVLHSGRMLIKLH